MSDDTKRAELFNAMQFLKIMKTWKPEEKWCTPTQIEEQERITSKCETEYFAQPPKG